MSTESSSPPAQTATGPHWEAITEEILCPLCDYNLRGLIEPRCPECGYKFAWPELIDPAQRLHPYLFEHHPERRVWSFWKTLSAGLRPRRFWRALHPAQPSYPKRLVLYWAFSVVPLLLTIPSNIGALAIAIRRENLPVRVQQRARLSHPRNSEWLKSTVEEYGSLDNYLDANFPVEWPSVLRFVLTYGENLVSLASPAAIFIAWPWLSLFGLFLFQISMRRARIRRAHVMRCVCYSSDIGCWLGSTFGFGILGAASLWSSRTPGLFLGMVNLEMLGCFMAILIFAYRLVVAYRSYLRFPRSLWVILAAQTITFLIFFILFILINVLIERA